MITDSAVACSDQRLYNKIVASFLFSWWSTLGLYPLCCAIAINSIMAAVQRFSSLIKLRVVNYKVVNWKTAMLEAYDKLKTKPKTIAELKESLQVIWGNLPQGPIDKTKRLLKLSD